MANKNLFSVPCKLVKVEQGSKKFKTNGREIETGVKTWLSFIVTPKDFDYLKQEVEKSGLTPSVKWFKEHEGYINLSSKFDVVTEVISVNGGHSNRGTIEDMVADGLNVYKPCCLTINITDDGVCYPYNISYITQDGRLDELESFATRNKDTISNLLDNFNEDELPFK